VGWSFDIAREKEDMDYLSDTPANQFGILVSPNQLRKPIYQPVMSFQRKLMIEYAKRYAADVSDVTTDAFVALTFEDGVSRYASIRDLLDIGTVTVESSAGSLTRIVAEQRRLQERLISEEGAWQDAGLRNSIVTNARKNGDMRTRKAIIPGLSLETRSFHTSALGGVYVYRDKDYGVVMIVTESDFAERDDRLSAIDRSQVIHMESADLVDHLKDKKIATIDMSWYASRQDVLAEKLDTLMMWIASLSEERPVLGELTLAQRRRFLSGAKPEVAELYFGLERLIAQVRQGRVRDELSPSLAEILLHPVAEASKHATQITWQLICRRQGMPIDPLRFYAVDKIGFFKSYRKWPDSFKDWVVPRIKARYRPVMGQKGA
jgi:hypothetical protein